ncbi:MAG TPA: WD40 repeat domain-containing protein [Mycobacteriales bacterium]|nr:WD40 repeat domain-containing protein [Mycobacteriales bacterium]
MSEPPPPVPRLRRGPGPTPGNGKKVLVGVLALFLVLLGFVLILVFTIGLNNNGVKIPSSQPSSAPTGTQSAGAPPTFFAIGADTGAAAFVRRGVVYRSQHGHARAVAAASAVDGRVGYFAVPVGGCRTRLDTLSAGRSIDLRKLATIAGRAQPVPMSISPDGRQLALVVQPRCDGRSQLVVYDLQSRSLRPLAGFARSAPVLSLAWASDSRRLAALTSGVRGGGGVVQEFTVATRSVPRGNPVGDARVVLWWHGRFAVISDGAIRTFSSAGLGATLGTGLPSSVTSVSVDPSGTRLLMSAGLQTVAEPGGISFGTTYVWSAGQARVLSSGHWDDPVW